MALIDRVVVAKGSKLLVGRIRLQTLALVYDCNVKPRLVSAFKLFIKGGKFLHVKNFCAST